MQDQHPILHPNIVISGVGFHLGFHFAISSLLSLHIPS